MTKLVLKCGDIEIDYEGPEEFLKEELPKFIQVIASLRGVKIPASSLQGGGAAVNATPQGELSVSTAAQKLGVANGPDLIIAAALSMVSAGASTFTKKQLREAIRDAKSYYKSSYSNNFDNYMNRLVKNGRLNHTSGDNYALPAGELSSLTVKLNGAAA